MGRLGRLGRNSAVLAAVALAAAGCGTPGQAGTARTQPRPAHIRPASTGAPLAPPSGSRALAERTSSRLMGDLVLPRGARPDRSGTLPAGLRQAAGIPDSGHLLQRHEVFSLARPAGWVLGYVRRHVPSGLTWAGGGQVGGPAGPRFVDWSPRHLPASLNEADLVVSVLAVGARTLVRVDTQVIWYPPRSRAEYVVPGLYAAARLREQLFNPHLHTVRLTVTSPAVIARLARTLDVLPADPGIQYACPAILAEYRVTFVPRAAGQPQIVAVPDGCNSVGMTVGGQQQPDLTGGWATMTLMNRLLGLTGTGGSVHHAAG